MLSLSLKSFVDCIFHINWERLNSKVRVSTKHHPRNLYILSPFPTFIFLFSKYMSLTLINSDQQGESPCLGSTHGISLPLRYFFLTIICHKPTLFSNFHHYLTSRFVFIFSRSFTPKPPFSFDLEIKFHFTMRYFLAELPPCQKKHLYFLLA
jgi:hypothetical protein